jgi:hypothetical protein
MSMAKHVRRVRGRPPTDFANRSVVSGRDAAALSSPTGREEGRPGDEPLSDFEAEVHEHEAGAQPMSEITGGPQGGTPDEDGDGLDEVERALRDAAEAPIGRREVGE